VCGKDHQRFFAGGGGGGGGGAAGTGRPIRGTGIGFDGGGDGRGEFAISFISFSPGVVAAAEARPSRSLF